MTVHIFDNNHSEHFSNCLVNSFFSTTNSPILSQNSISRLRPALRTRPSTTCWSPRGGRWRSISVTGPQPPPRAPPPPGPHQASQRGQHQQLRQAQGQDQGGGGSVEQGPSPRASAVQQPPHQNTRRQRYVFFQLKETHFKRFVLYVLTS